MDREGYDPSKGGKGHDEESTTLLTVAATNEIPASLVKRKGTEKERNTEKGDGHDGPSPSLLLVLSPFAAVDGEKDGRTSQKGRTKGELKKRSRRVLPSSILRRW
jgi:hypothetical protein